MWASIFLLMKEKGFSMREIRRMTLPQLQWWMKAMDIAREASKR